MDKLGHIINKRLNQHRLGDAARAALILNQANGFLSKKLQCTDVEVRAFRLKDGILFVSTVGSVWSQEVYFQQEGLLAEIRKEHGQKSVLKVVIKSLTSN